MKLGLCCISLALQEKGYKFQTMTFSRFSSLPRQTALQILSDRILNNFKVTKEIIYYCKNNNFSSYRFSSSLTPVINHPDVSLSLDQLPNAERLFLELRSIKEAILSTGLKISAHPSEYISLTSPDESVINNSVRDLVSHSELFDLVGLPQSSEAPLNIHCRQDGSPQEISDSFLKNFEKLPDGVKNRLTLEVNDNHDGTWSISKLHKFFFERAGIPICFDSLHHKFCNDGLSEKDAFDLAYSSWKTTPVFHYSEGINGTRKHADYATGVPPDYNKDVYWDVELKQKDKAILQMLNK
jgi:UV DNA damage endonuclease